jgi:hypothetical protein
VLWPPPLRNPAIPAGATPESAPTRYSELDNDQREALRTLNKEYNRDIKRYNKKVKASAEFKSKIQESVHKDNFEYTTNCASVWEILYKLKARFAPTDKAKELKVITDWQKVTKKPEQSTDIEHWLQKVETTYDRAVLMKIPDMDGTRAHYAFCDAVATLYPTFATMWEIKLLKADTVPFKEIVSDFRDLYRIVKQRSRGKTLNSTFSASFQGQPPDPNKPLPLCLCGEHHFYSQCRYLIPAIRPTGWKPAAAIQSKADKALSSASLFTKKNVPKARDRAQQQQQQQQGQPDLPGPTAPMTSTGPLATIMAYHGRRPLGDSNKASFQVSHNATSSVYELHDSIILDSGSTCHVGNDRTRFTLFVPAKEDKVLFARETVTPI